MQPLGEELPQKLQGGRVDPVQILDDEQDRPPLGVGAQPSRKARNVSSRSRTGDKPSGGKRSSGGSDKSDANSGTTSGRGGRTRSRWRTSRSNRAAAASSRPKPRNRSKKSLTGYRLVFW